MRPARLAPSPSYLDLATSPLKTLALATLALLPARRQREGSGRRHSPRHLRGCGDARGVVGDEQAVEYLPRQGARGACMPQGARALMSPLSHHTTKLCAHSPVDQAPICITALTRPLSFFLSALALPAADALGPRPRLRRPLPHPLPNLAALRPLRDALPTRVGL